MLANILTDKPAAVCVCFETSFTFPIKHFDIVAAISFIHSPSSHNHHDFIIKSHISHTQNLSTSSLLSGNHHCKLPKAPEAIISSGESQLAHHTRHKTDTADRNLLPTSTLTNSPILLAALPHRLCRNTTTAIFEQAKHAKDVVGQVSRPSIH